MADFFLSKYWDKEFPEKSTIFFCFTHYSDINSRLRLGSIVNPPPTSPLNSLSFWCKFWYKFQVEAMQCSYAPPLLLWTAFLCSRNYSCFLGQQEMWMGDWAHSSSGGKACCAVLPKAWLHAPFYHPCPAKTQKSWKRAESNLLLACWKCRPVFFG